MHVSRADLNGIGIPCHQVNVAGFAGFGHCGQISLPTGLSKNLQTLFTQTLEIIRRGTRLECAPS